MPALRPRVERPAARSRSAAWPAPTRAAASRPNSPRWPPSSSPPTIKPRHTDTRESEGPMPVNVALGHVSNAFMIAALVIYSFSVVAFAGDFAFGRPRRAAEAAREQQAEDRAAELASVGAAGGPAAGPGEPAAPA